MASQEETVSVQSKQTQQSTSTSRRPHYSVLTRKRDTLMSTIRTSLKTSIYSMKIDQFTMVLFQNEFAPISPYFIAYKYCHTFMMIGGLAYSITLREEEAYVIEWHLFLDHWMSVAATAEALVGVFTVTYFYHHCHTKAMRDAYSLSEGLHVRLLIYAYINSTTITFVCASSVIFWFFIYGNSPTTAISIESIVLPVLLILKMNIEMIPFTVDLFMYPVLVMILYFIDVIIYYYIDFKTHFLAGKQKTYIFVYFNEKSLLHFLWFVLESLLITVGVHVILTLLWHSRWLFMYICCPKRFRDSRQSPSERGSPEGTRAGYITRHDYIDAVPDPRESASKRCWRRIKDLERLYRHDFVQPEWKHKLTDRPSLVYVLYRTGHFILHFCMLFISLFEPEKSLKKRSVKYFILWLFYFGNFFLCVSFVQALMGFSVIIMAYTRKTSLKYYEQSELHVTGFQKAYAAINGCAVALACFAFLSSWVLVADTSIGFSSHDYTYDVPHVVNPLSMCLDFIIVGHPYKFLYFVLSFGILAMNLVFNYWLYSSRITSRVGAKFIYEYLNWDKPMTVTVHIAVLYGMLTAIHIALWLTLLIKRSLNVAFQRRHLYRRRQQKIRDSVDSFILESQAVGHQEPEYRPPPLAYDLATTISGTIRSEAVVNGRNIIDSSARSGNGSSSISTGSRSNASSSQASARK